MDIPSTVPGTTLQRMGNYVEGQSQAQARTAAVEPHWYDVWSHTLDGYQQGAATETTLFGSELQNSPDAQEMSSTSMTGVGEAVAEQGNVLWNQLKQLTHQTDDPKQNPKGFLQHMGLALSTLTTIEQGLSALLSWIPFPAFPALHVMNMGVGLPHGHPHPPNLIPPAPPIPLPSMGPIIPIPILSGAANVLINGQPAARCGDLGLGIWCGGYFPMYEIFLGSSSVWVEGARAARVGIDITKHCIMSSGAKDIPIGVPIGMTVTASGNVMVGGIPMPSLTAIAMKYIFKGIGKLGKGLWGRLKNTNFIKNWKCQIFGGEPVNILTGEVAVDQKDFSVSWPMPLVWTRRYRSGNTRQGLCGVGWETLADARLVLEEDGSVVFYDGQTGGTLFPSLPAEGPVREAVDGGLLNRTGSRLTVLVKGGRIYQFPDFVPEQSEVLIDAVTDLCGNGLHFFRNQNGLVEIQSSAGPRIMVKSRLGRIEQLLLYHPQRPRVLAHYEYDQVGDLRAVYDPLGIPYRFEYAQHCLVRHVNRNNLSFHYKFDRLAPDGRVVHSWGDGGLYDYRFSYDRTQRQTTITDSLGYVTVMDLDDSNFPVAETNSLGGITFYEYDDYGRTSAVVDPDGRRTEYYHDSHGNLIKLIRPDGQAIVTEFDENDNPLVVKDPNGNVWLHEWDARSLLVKQTSPLGAVRQYQYDHRGQLAAVTNPRGAVTRLNYDNCGNIIGLINALGHETRFQVDELGNVLAKIDPLGHKTTYYYDEKSRLVSRVSASGGTIECRYDAEDNLISYRDEVGYVTRLEYCGLGEVSKRHQPDGYLVSYCYDTEERLIGITNQRGQRYEFHYDALGRLIEEVDYWEQSKKYVYDRSGHLQRSIDALGRVIEYQTDLLGRLKERQLPGGLKEEFSYDHNGNLIAMTNQFIKVERKFDVDGRLLEEHQGDFTIYNTYDLNGNRIIRQSSLGNIVAYEFDALDQVQTICINDAEPIRIERDAQGHAIREALAQELHQNCSFNADGLIVKQGVQIYGRQIVAEDYSYDLRGEMVHRSDLLHGTDLFIYEPMRRVREHVDPEGRVHKYLYDPVGDLLRPISNGEDNNGVWSRTEQFRGMTYQFNGSGNLIEKRDGENVLRLEWDDSSRLTRSETSIGNGCLTSYGYDIQGRRIFKQNTEQYVSFFWDGDFLLGDKLANGHQREFIYYPNSARPIAIIEQINLSKKLYFYQCKPNGLPSSIFDSAGNVVWLASYTAMGAANQTEETIYGNPLRLQGQYVDNETGLVYNRHRYYDAAIGKFISQDPLGISEGEDIYRLAPNIWSWVDPLGLACNWVGAVNISWGGRWRIRMFGRAPSGRIDLFVIRDIVRIEIHPISQKLPQWLHLPHMHLDFLPGQWSHMHIPYEFYPGMLRDILTRIGL